jgi:hypothetical protein
MEKDDLEEQNICMNDCRLRLQIQLGFKLKEILKRKTKEEEIQEFMIRTQHGLVETRKTRQIHEQMKQELETKKYKQQEKNREEERINQEFLRIKYLENEKNEIIEKQQKQERQQIEKQQKLERRQKQEQEKLEKQEKKQGKKELDQLKKEIEKIKQEMELLKQDHYKVTNQNQQQENQYKCINCKCRKCDTLLYLTKLQRNGIKRLMINSITFEKKKNSIEYLGCSIEQFKDFVENKMTPSMNWDNIHLDHIKPVSIFNLNDEEEFLKCCHYTNFQPLLAKDNLSKSSKWNAENEIFWKENIYGKPDYFEIYNV